MRRSMFEDAALALQKAARLDEYGALPTAQRVATRHPAGESKDGTLEINFDWHLELPGAARSLPMRDYCLPVTDEVLEPTGLPGAVWSDNRRGWHTRPKRTGR